MAVLSPISHTQGRDRDRHRRSKSRSRNRWGGPTDLRVKVGESFARPLPFIIIYALHLLSCLCSVVVLGFPLAWSSMSLLDSVISVTSHGAVLGGSVLWGGQIEGGTFELKWMKRDATYNLSRCRDLGVWQWIFSDVYGFQLSLGFLFGGKHFRQYSQMAIVGGSYWNFMKGKKMEKGYTRIVMLEICPT